MASSSSSSPFEEVARGQEAGTQHANGRHGQAAGVRANHHMNMEDYKYSDITSAATPATQDIMEVLGEQGYHPHYEHQPGYDDPVIREAITQTASRWLEDHPEFASQSGAGRSSSSFCFFRVLPLFSFFSSPLDWRILVSLNLTG